MRITYGRYEDFPGWDRAAAFFGGLIERHDCRVVLEIGSGANPTLAPAYVHANGLSYTTNDVLEDELAKAGDAYQKLCLDMAIADESALPRERFDLVFSRMVNEHVADGRRYYGNIFSALKPGGVSAHCFSTLYALPFVMNRLLPETVSSPALDAVAPRDRHQHDKFRAHYSWSRGPTRRMLSRLRGIGFEVLEYRGYFGHGYYDRRFLRPLDRLEAVKSSWLSRHPVAALTSYAAVVLRRPGA